MWSPLKWGGGGTPILGHGREVPWWWPPFGGFSIRLGHYFIPQYNPIDSQFVVKKIGLSLSYLVPEIIGPKVGLIVHQNVLFNRFKAFCMNFLLIYNQIGSLFHWFWIFLTPHFHKTLDPIGSNSFRVLLETIIDPLFHRYLSEYRQVVLHKENMI